MLKSEFFSLCPEFMKRLLLKRNQKNLTVELLKRIAVTSETTVVFEELIKRGYPCNKMYINVSTKRLQNMH
jgi:hypothetical protein